jgi:pyrimidine-nucleoside phosphorylase
VAGIDALEVGRLGLELGIGRKTTDSAIDPAAGFRFLRKTGEAVGKGEVIAEVQGSNPKAVSSVSGRLGELIRISTHRVRVPPLILGRVRPGN